jgi:hypothetical protein
MKPQHQHSIASTFYCTAFVPFCAHSRLYTTSLSIMVEPPGCTFKSKENGLLDDILAENSKIDRK